MKKYYKSKKGKIAKRKGYSIQKKKHPERLKARQAIYKATIRGKIISAKMLQCKKCGDQKAAHFHHYAGYEWKNRFKVIPLCVDCHWDIHR